MSEQPDTVASWEAAAEAFAQRVRNNEDIWRPGILDPAHLELVGDVRGLDVLDLGCGEGRFARMLAERGAHVTAVDVAPTMVRLAQEMEDQSSLGVRYLLRDAARLDGLPDGSFHLVVAYMSLMDVEDYRSAVTEVARVLKGGGRFIFSLVHPCYDVLPPMGWERSETGEALYFKVDDCLTPRRIPYPLWLDRPDPVVISFHRSLSDYAGAVRDANLFIRDLVEPVPTQEALTANPDLKKRLRIPGPLIFECVKTDGEPA